MEHRATEAFWRAYQALPPEIQSRADKQFALLKSALAINRALKAPPSFRTEQADFFFRFRSCESVGLPMSDLLAIARILRDEISLRISSVRTGHSELSRSRIETSRRDICGSNLSIAASGAACTI